MASNALPRPAVGGCVGAAAVGKWVGAAWIPRLAPPPIDADDGVDDGGEAKGSGMAKGSTSPAGVANGSGSDGAAEALPTVTPLAVPWVKEDSHDGARFRSGGAVGDVSGETTGN